MDQKLKDGYQHFLTHRFQEDRALYEELATMGQTPHTLMIACSDSRVLPQHILNSGPGDLFLVRNVAALVPPYEADDGYHGTSAAIEFAVTVLKVQNIMVMGHTGCGGVGHVAQGHACPTSGTRSFVSQWMAPLDSWMQKNTGILSSDLKARSSMLERAAINMSIDNLKTFPFIQERLAEKSLNIHGTIFDIHTGELNVVTQCDDGTFGVAPFE
ncbi:carbonic anhydrase [Kordiimonas sediminis]|uniref:Carbonic anhydrase n=1 Tax=Kordiimonas sediminis TaxID=1735581 RepID=A0A919AQZ5_9PROT|nr:carbonic anhydrase [Kordiimonas sediminis]GHF21092.1 carbonic anhydrase [Kordiimonas sediminis]